MANAGYAVTFTVVDNATKQIDAIGRHIQQLRQPLDRMSKQTQRFIDSTGLNTVARGFDWISKTAASALAPITAMVPALGAITSAATIAGLVNLVNQFATLSRNLVSNADQIGITTEELEKLQQATRAAGGNANDMTESLKALHTAQADMLVGKGNAAEQIQWMQKLGVSWKNANGTMRDTADLMPDVIDAISKLKDPTDRARAAQALLGGTGQQLIETFRMHAGGVRDAQAAVKDYGTETEDQKKTFQEFGEEQGKLGIDIDNLGRTIATVGAQYLTPLMRSLREFYEQNLPGLLQGISDSAKQVNAAFKPISDTLDGIQQAANDAGKYVYEHFTKPIEDGIQTAMDAVNNAVQVAGTTVHDFFKTNLASITVLFTDWIATAKQMWQELWDSLTAGWQKVYDYLKGLIDQAKALIPGFGGGGGKLDQGPRGPAEPATPGIAQPPPFEQAVPTPGGYRPGHPRYGVPSEPPPTNMNLPSAQVQRGAAIRDKLATDLGLTKEQASGIVGNLQAESGIKAINEKSPLVAGSRGGFGWAQWTGPRRDAFEAYAKEHGLDPKSDEANYGFLRQELKSGEYAGMLDKIRGAKSATEAARIVEAGYEKPAVSNAETRGRYATQIASAEAPPPAPGVPAPQPMQLASAATPGVPAPPAPGVPAPAPPAPAPAPAPMQLASADSRFQPLGGAAVSTAPPPGRVDGAVDVSITHKNAPPDATVTAKGSGSVNVQPVRVEHQELSTV